MSENHDELKSHMQAINTGFAEILRQNFPHIYFDEQQINALSTTLMLAL